MSLFLLLQRHSSSYSGLINRARSIFSLERLRKANMEITNSNFAAKLPEIEAAIDSADFVAIDGEFTGIEFRKHLSPFDLPRDRYIKAKESTSKYLLVQFGLCTFHYDQEEDVYKNRAYNFYVWPRPYGRLAPDAKFLCQTSSIDFLISQNFDFNKLFKDGVSYLKRKDKLVLQSMIMEKQKERQERRSSLQTQGTTTELEAIPIPEKEQDFLDRIHQKIEKFLQNSNQKDFYLDRANPFQRKLIYQSVKEKFGDKVFLESVVNEKRERVIRVIRKGEPGLSQEDHLTREVLKGQEELKELEEAVGFCKVIQKLSSSQKLVVGHNMILDLCHTLNQFVEPLPEEYLDFKELCLKTFPKILDTKLMATTAPLSEEIVWSSLEELRQTCGNHPYEIPEVKAASTTCGYSLESEKYHEAGYDAFITGLCFAAMANRLGSFSQDKSVFKHPKTGKIRVLPDSPLISPFLNKLFLMRVSDIPYIDLANEDVEPNRDHVFHVTFPSSWKASNLSNLFSPFGPIQISWINDTSAFVALQYRAGSSHVMNRLNNSPMFSILPYRQFKDFQTSGQSSVMESTPKTLTENRLNTETGITPDLEKSRLSFEDFIERNKLSVPKQLLDKPNPSVTDSASDVPKKRSASPENETFKRSKSMNDNTDDNEEAREPQKKQHFDVPSWD